MQGSNEGLRDLYIQTYIYIYAYMYIYIYIEKYTYNVDFNAALHV